MFQYSFATGRWTWIGGSTVIPIGYPTLGAPGVFSSSNWPPAAQYVSFAFDTMNNVAYFSDGEAKCKFCLLSSGPHF